MSKLRHLIPLALLLIYIVVPSSLRAQNKYSLHIRGVDKDSAFIVNTVGVENSFADRGVAIAYLNKLSAYLQSKGYVSSSIDELRYDSTSARLVLYLGEKYRWAELNASRLDPTLLSAVGWRTKTFAEKPMDFQQVEVWQDRILQHLENNGYPFAKVWLDSVEVNGEKVNAIMRVDRGPLYKIDSLRIFGDVKVSKAFLYRYLNLPPGSDYSRQRLQLVSRKILELPYVEETKRSDVTLLPTGSVLNLYLKPKRTSQINLLIGFLPNSDQYSTQKLLITGEGTLNLKNALGYGETIGLSFQKLQVKSQRLNIFYQHPYLFDSPIGLDFSFDMYRRDSIYLNINFQFGASYIISMTQSGKVYLQRFQTIANGINTIPVVQNHRLADEADVSSWNLGVDYAINTTDYIRNPRRGIEFLISTTAGSKNIKKNNQILQLKDPNDPSFDFAKLYDTVKLNTYQFRIKTSAAKYFPLGKQGAIKTAINAGFFQSANIFRNELFQIGGFKLLRGFDEESQYLSQFAIGTAEYHYLIGINSYFYTFIDGGWGRNNSQNNDISHTYISTGLGLAFERKVGVFNIAWAIGQRNDIPFNLRQSKIHFGFVNYF
jgi:outer membrane protein assembly factor BamA